MSELNFLKGVDAALPAERIVDTFYVTTDTKKIMLNDAVWQDTEDVKAEIKEIIEDNELTIAAALTELKETKADISAITEAFETKQDVLVSGVNIKTINNQSILGSGNIAIDFSFYNLVTELPTSNIDTNKIYVLPSESSGDKNLYTEYMYINGSWEIIGTYAASVNLDGYATQEWVNEQAFAKNSDLETLSSTLDNYALQEDLESLSGSVLDNEVTIAAALTDLEETKADKTEIPSLDGYATESWVSDGLTNYYTKEEVDNKGYLTAVPDTFVTEEELGTAISDKVDSSALTESLEAYALQADLETLSGNVLDNEVTIAAALTDLEETKADKTEIPSLDGYATQEWVEGLDYVSAEELASQGYATETLVNQGLATKQDTLVSGTNIKTINGESLLIDSATTETNIVLDVNIFKVVASLPTEASEIETNKIYLVLSPESAEGNVYIEYMYINDVWEEIGKYTATIDLTPYALVETVEAVDARVSELSGGVLSNEVTIAAALTDLNKRKLDSSALTENLGAYALKSDMEASDVLLQENIDAEVTAREEAIAELVQEIEDNELITVQALTDLRETKLDKTEVPSMEGYATEEWVTDNFSQVEVDLSDYYTKSEVDAQLANIDLSDYYNKNEVDAIVTALNDEISENETVAAKALTQLNDTKANVDDIPSYATQIRVLNESGLFTGSTIEEVLVELYNMINPQNEA